MSRDGSTSHVLLLLQLLLFLFIVTFDDGAHYLIFELIVELLPRHFWSSAASTIRVMVESPL